MELTFVLGLRHNGRDVEDAVGEGGGQHEVGSYILACATTKAMARSLSWLMLTDQVIQPN